VRLSAGLISSCSCLLPHCYEHASQTVDQIDNLALPLHVKLYFKISLGRVINCLFQAQEWLDDLARQDIADPNADEQGHD
jgi:hypothetical protein